MTIAPTGPSARRYRGLDAFRGLAVVGMLLVNNPGDHDAVYSQLEHSAWNGCTIADLVFPFFLFVVGITTTISLASMADRNDDAQIRARIWRRAGTILGIGLLINWFPFYQSGHIDWAAHPSPMDRLLARLLMLRMPGVLQRIAVAYLAAALIARRASSRTIALLAALILVGYWLLLTSVPVPGETAPGAILLGQPSHTIVAHVDRALFDWSRWGLGNHLWDSAVTWDPEGALSTLPAVATVLIGVLYGRWLLQPAPARRSGTAIAAGIGLTLAGLLWSVTFPLNKSLWTSSFVLFTAGIGLLGCVAFIAILERQPDAWWARPLVIFGENPLIAYAGSEIARRILHSSIKLAAPGGRLGADEWTARHLTGLGFSPAGASLAWALIFLGAWWLLLAHLSRRRYLLRM